MIRKLFIIAAITALATAAYAQSVPPGPNAEFNNNPWESGNATRTTTGYVLWDGTNPYDYHMDGKYKSGSGVNTVWEGDEWGSGQSNDDTTIGANMCTMGIAVFSDFGITIDLFKRFYEINAGAMHGAPATHTITFNGHVATNSTIMIGLRAFENEFLQFPSGEYNPQITEIRAFKDGQDVGTWQPDEGDVYDALFEHQACHADFRFEVDVVVPTHVNDGMHHVPFYFCPGSTL